MDRAAKDVNGFSRQVDRASQTSARSMGGLGGAIGKLGTVMAGVFAGTQIVDFARDSIMAASDLEESVNAVNVVFGEAAEAIHEFGKTSVDSVGLAAVNVNKSATVLGSALINAGLDAEEAAAKTIELTTRASDMASVFNTTVPDALGAIQAALRGETDPIEKFGVSLSAAAVEAEAASLGFTKVGGEFTTTAKSAARMSLIMKQTERVAGDFQNTADSASNTMKRLNERFTETKARVGQALMPAFTALLGVAEDLAPAFEDFAVEIADLVSEIKPLLELAGDLVGIYSNIKGWTDEASDSTSIFEQQLGKVVDLLTSGGLGILGKIFDEFTPKTKDAGEKARDLARAEEEAGRLAQYMADATKDDLVPALEGSLEPLGKVEGAHRDAATAARAHRDALDQLTSRLLAHLNPVLGAVQAVQDLKTAEQEARDAARDFGSDSDEAAEAQIRLALATAEAQTALLNLGNVEGAVSAIAEVLKITDDAAADLLIRLGLITEKDWETTVIIGIRTQGDIKALESGVIPEGLGLPSNTTISSGNIIRRASGGPVRPNEPYWVGENGPEVIIPRSSGMVIPNHNLGRGGGGVTINVNNPKTQNLAQDLQLAALLGSVRNLVEA
jgi:hypothetical protein